MGQKNRGKHIIRAQREEITIGPIPPPAHLEQYEHILPGSADRILSMAERQSAHRQVLESKVIKSDIRNSLVGLIFGFIIGMTGVTSGFYLIYLGKILEGSIFSGVTIAALVSTFIYGSQQRRKERQSKPQ
jgi:uncharacterized membrane protein